MFSLSENRHTESSFILGQNYTQLYNRLKDALGEKVFLFARPDMLSQTTKWTSELPDTIKIGAVRSFTELSEAEKDELSDYIENAQYAIEQILQQKTDLKEIIPILFRLPNESDIKVIQTDEGLRPIFTQWGCKTNATNSTIDPVAIAIGRPRADSSKVILEVQYTDGSPAVGKTYFQEYLGKETTQKTNAEGKRDMGRIKHGVSFRVYDIENGQKKYLHTFTVERGGRYLMLIPLFTEGRVRVINQKQEPIAQVSVQIVHDNTNKTLKTNELGIIELADLEVGKEIFVCLADDSTNQTTSTIKRENNEFILRIFEPVYSEARIEVRNEQNQPETNYRVWVDYDGKKEELVTNEQGVIHLPRLLVGKELRATDTLNTSNTVAQKIVEGENILLLQIHRLQPKMVQVRLVNHRKAPLPNIPIDFAYNTQKKTLTTNEPDALCWLPFDTFVNKEKVQATIHLPTKKGEKIVKKSFVFKQDTLHYTLKLRRYNYWWLLLLLLLLLLIRCEKTTFVKVINSDSKQVIPNIAVNYNYRTHYVYDKGGFFTNTPINRTQNTDSKGIAKFDTVRYSVYGYLLYHLTTANIWASDKCYVSDKSSRYFHWIWNNDTIVLYQKPKIEPLDLKVIDKSDNEPLPDASVRLIAELDGKKYEETLKSGADGRVVTSKIPQCAKIQIIKATLDGYYPDSIAQKTVTELLSGTLDSLRTLKLKPIRKPIEFFVVECNTKPPKPIPSATVTIDIVGKKKVKARTNVNGVGKGVYDSLHVKAKITLEAEKPYYKRGKLEGNYSVEEFINLPKGKRTICLEPEPNPIEFKNIDERTQQPLVGVKNIVKRKRGGEVRIDTLVSNRDGNFLLSDVIASEEISIIAQYPPDYEDNDRTIRNKAGEEIIKKNPNERIIPLKPKIVELVFRTVNGENNQLLPDVNVVILENGRPLPAPTNSGNGEFKVVVKAGSVISVRASKPCLGQNITKIVNRPAKALAEAPQAERDIPLTRSVLAKLRKCFNAGRPSYALYIDGTFIKNMTSTSGLENGIQTYEDIDIRNLASGRHTFKFVKLAGATNGTCGGCTRFKIDCMPIDNPFNENAEIVWEVNIP
jgi:hypothetical protein